MKSKSVAKHVPHQISHARGYFTWPLYSVKIQ